MKNQSIRFLVCVFFLLVLTQTLQAQQSIQEFKPLHLQNFIRFAVPNEVSKSSYELSGVAKLHDGQMIFVTDDDADHYIYRLSTGGKDAILSPWLDLTNVDRFPEYLEEQKQKSGGKSGKSLDLEGMTICEEHGRQTIFLINERVRDVVKMQKQVKGVSFSSIGESIRNYFADKSHFGSIESVLNIHQQFLGADGQLFDSLIDYTNKPLFGKVPADKPGAEFDNAGYEGIAADCKGQVLYIAKERQPRYIIKTDFDGNVLGLITIPTNSRSYRLVQDPFKGTGSFLVEPDVSDLYFFDNHIFALERSSGDIVEMDTNGHLIQRYDYSPWENIYNEITKTRMVAPFGMAETLVVEKQKSKYVFKLGFDNGNENKLNAKGFEIFGCHEGSHATKSNCLEQNAVNTIMITLTE